MARSRRAFWIKATAVACFLAGSVLLVAALVRWPPAGHSDGTVEWRLRPGQDTPPSPPAFTPDSRLHPTWAIGFLEYAAGSILLWMPLVLYLRGVSKEERARTGLGFGVLLAVSSMCAFLGSLLTISAVMSLFSAL